jgi:hypothetical protein
MKQYSLKNNEGQLLLIGGIIITFLILAMAAISISVSEINKPIYKKEFIRQNYANIREEFGRTYNDSIKDKKQWIKQTEPSSENTICKPYFNYTTQLFIFVAKSDGNYFNAVYVSTDYNVDGSFKGLTADLSFNNGKESISERVIYVLT